MDQSVIGPGPEDPLLMRGLDEGEDGGIHLGPGVVLGDGTTRGFQGGRVVAGQIRRDDLPGHALIGGTMDVVGGDVEGVRIMWRVQDRERPLEPIAEVLGAVAHAGQFRPRSDDALFFGSMIVTNEAAIPRATADRAADHDIRIGRFDGDVTALAATRLIPVGLSDGTGRRCTRNGQRGIVLLRTIQPVRHLIVGGHVIELRRRLVENRRP